MSTFFASFDNIESSRNAVEQLVSSGVRPDDISVVTRQSYAGAGSKIAMLDDANVGDASFFVGRGDDPEQVVPNEPPFAEATTTREFSGTMGIDTSDLETDIESVDQSDDSQSASEDLIDPPNMISNGEHEADDLALAYRTGFPTAAPVIDDIEDSEGPRQEQLTSSVETLALPGGGTIIGGGALATAAFDLNTNPDNVRAFLRDEGLDDVAIAAYWQALDDGHALLAVSVAPGSVQEPMVEQVVESCGGKAPALFDAPRFGDTGYVA